jgi:hypothetical protein
MSVLTERSGQTGSARHFTKSDQEAGHLDLTMSALRGGPSEAVTALENAGAHCKI